MADWKDWLEGVSGGFMGITKGLTAGMEPFNAYEKVRTQDLANDKSDVQLRDLYGVQDAREAFPNYYPNVVGAADSTNRFTTAKNNLGVFGAEQDLGLNEYLASPGFQEFVQGLDPRDPAYRQQVAEAIALFKPEAGIAAYDKYKIPEMQQRNLNLQAVGRYIESQAQKYDAGAYLQWLDDGTAVVIGSDGSTKVIEPTMMIRAASMMSQKDPYTAVSTGIGDEIKIATANTALVRALQTGATTPTQAIKILTEQRLQIQRQAQPILDEWRAVQKSVEWTMASPEEKARIRAEYEARYKPYDDAYKRLRSQAEQLQTSGYFGGGGGAQLPGVRTQGNPAVTTNRLPISNIIGQALGGSVGGAPDTAPSGGALWGQSSEGGNAYPTPRYSGTQRQLMAPSGYSDSGGDLYGGTLPPYDTGIRPIEQLVQQILQGQ